MSVRRAMGKRQAARFCGRYVAVTGSCGKTTTTTLIGYLLGEQGSARVGVGENTEKHVWRLLRNLDAPVDFVVQEVSEFPLGHLMTVGKALHPNAAVVTSVGLDHLAAFRTVERVAEEIVPLVASVPAAGIVCLNADDPQCAGLARHSAARVIRFGRAPDADLRIENVQSELPGRLRFDIVVGERRRPVQTRFVGTLMLTNLAGALATVYGLGLDLDRAIADLAKMEPLDRRMHVVETPAGHSFVFDMVKAPLWSTRLIVDDLPNMSSGRRILVLGEMSDLGSEASRKYRQVIRRATEKCDLVIGIGAGAGHVARVKSMHSEMNVKAARDVEHLAQLLAEEPPSLVVFKGKKIDVRPEQLVGSLRPSLVMPAV